MISNRCKFSAATQTTYCKEKHQREGEGTDKHHAVTQLKQQLSP